MSTIFKVITELRAYFRGELITVLEVRYPKKSNMASRVLEVVILYARPTTKMQDA